MNRICTTVHVPVLVPENWKMEDPVAEDPGALNVNPALPAEGAPPFSSTGLPKRKPYIINSDLRYLN